LTRDKAPPTALMLALALPGCAPVGPNFERPAAIVSAQLKEVRGWKIATLRTSEPKGEWWSVFHDPELGGHVERCFFKTLKAELVWRTLFQSRIEAASAIGRYIDTFYNPVRRHSALDFISPLQFEGRAA